MSKMIWAISFSAIAFVVVAFGNQVLAKESIMPASVVSQSQEQINGKIFFVDQVTIHVAPTTVWKILVDYQHMNTIFSEVTACHVLSDKGDSKIVYMEVQPLPPFPSYKYTIETKETYPSAIEWRRVSGDFKTNQGFFKLESLNNGTSTLLTFAKCIEMDLPFSQLIIKHNLTTLMPRDLHSLKVKAEQSSMEAISIAP